MRNAIAPGKNIVKTMIAPTDVYDTTKPHTNFAMDDVAQEYYSQVTENTYEQQNTINPDFPSAPNFGTLDNPLQIFTTDYPFRFVACTGHPNEDDYEGHEPMWFILREGSMQRCSQCGQVFKLIKLRQNEQERNQYYNSLIGKSNLQELGDQDHPGLTSLRTFFQLQETPTFSPNPQSVFYSALNPDDHDRFLVDPKYRMERNMEGERVAHQVMKNFKELSDMYEEKYGTQKKPLNRRVYENLVEAQLAVKNLDRHFSNILKFNYRQILDPENHDRREKRMLMRQHQRTHSKRLIQSVVDKEKEKYMDYFETDLEKEDSQQQIFDMFNEDKQDIFRDQTMKLKNIEFQELQNTEKTHDMDGVLNRKIFRFKYREALYPEEDHIRKEKRMIERNSDLDYLKELQMKSIKKNKFYLLEDKEKDCNQDQKNIRESERYKAELQFYEELIKKSEKCYKDYFESDLEEDFEIVEDMPFQTKVKLTDALKNTHVNFALRVFSNQNQLGSDYNVNQIENLYEEISKNKFFKNKDLTLDNMNLQEVFELAEDESLVKMKKGIQRVQKILQDKSQGEWSDNDHKTNVQKISESIKDLETRIKNGEDVQSQLQELRETYRQLKQKIVDKLGELGKDVFNIKKEDEFDQAWEKGKERNQRKDPELEKQREKQWNEKIEEEKKNITQSKDILKDSLEKTKEKAEEAWENTKQKVTEVEDKIPEMKEKAKKVWEKTKEQLKDTAEIAKEKLQHAKEVAKDKAEVAKEKLQQSKEVAQDKAEIAKEKLKHAKEVAKDKAENLEQKAEQNLQKGKQKLNEMKNKTKKILKQVDERVQEKSNIAKERLNQTKNNKETANKNDNKNKKK